MDIMINICQHISCGNFLLYVDLLLIPSDPTDYALSYIVVEFLLEKRFIFVFRNCFIFRFILKIE